MHIAGRHHCVSGARMLFAELRRSINHVAGTTNKQYKHVYWHGHGRTNAHSVRADVDETPHGCTTRYGNMIDSDVD